MAAAAGVDDYMAGLVHARKLDVERLRALVLAAAPGITEQLKWNAPSFGVDGEDRVTMRLQRLSLTKDSRLFRWLAADRSSATI